MSAIHPKHMLAVGEAFSRRVRRALGAPGRSPLGAILTAPLVTALVVDGGEMEFSDWPERALLELRNALERTGVPRGRQFVLIGSQTPQRLPLRPERVAWLREWLSLPVHLHEPSGPAFTAGRLADGEPIELDDELREAEAIVCVGMSHVTSGQVFGGPYLLVPNVASLATRRAIEVRHAQAGQRGVLAFALAAETQAPVDLALTWDPEGRVSVGRGRVRFAGLARRSGFA